MSGRQTTTTQEDGKTKRDNTAKTLTWIVVVAHLQSMKVVQELLNWDGKRLKESKMLKNLVSDLTETSNSWFYTQNC